MVILVAKRAADLDKLQSDCKTCMGVTLEELTSQMTERYQYLGLVKDRVMNISGEQQINHRQK